MARKSFVRFKNIEKDKIKEEVVMLYATNVNIG